ncbi:HU family DNA-binding protein [Streptosporangium sp. CA-115845]|uniref:HU family DNA-binding protein n=1 Tax=Streptosporangium sp. CA-115845 TaxID=3240071 RepID=UPI003D8B4F35
MNRNQLIEAITTATGATKKAASETLDAALSAIQSAVASGDRVSLPGFGTFERQHKPERGARNPGTGEQIRVPENWGPKFKPGSEFKEVVNAGGKQAAAVS